MHTKKYSVRVLGTDNWGRTAWQAYEEDQLVSGSRMRSLGFWRADSPTEAEIHADLLNAEAARGLRHDENGFPIGEADFAFLEREFVDIVLKRYRRLKSYWSVARTVIAELRSIHPSDWTSKLVVDCMKTKDWTERQVAGAINILNKWGPYYCRKTRKYLWFGIDRNTAYWEEVAAARAVNPGACVEMWHPPRSESKGKRP